MPSVAVVTATTGRDSLRKTIGSVKDQTYPCQHYVFWDGVDVNEDVFHETEVLNVRLPVKTGGNGIMNGGIVAASAYLVQEDYICWLDDDNTFEPDHIENLVKAIEGKEYAYSLRKFIGADGRFFDYDDFESIGEYSGFIDLNCYLMDRKNTAVKIAALWYQTTGKLMIGDRYVSAYLFQNKINGACTGKYTVNYLLNKDRDLTSWVFNGNIKSRAKYAGELPWRK